ncbi:hypothetical protein CMI47_22335 [Candidatus Pacearchaeota archaeon]|nr:hypothetical protein [Candidatus Pacearchaeota archaeon]|tara:strand:- start:3083 stop:3736 length:654 start_codon:yes stop_codon:yes gene_type:complete
MESFLKKIIEGRGDEDSHEYFVRFGKGDYKRRFLIGFNKGAKVKIKASFELANDFVRFVRENKDVKFSGKVFMKEKLPGKDAKKKGGTFMYEIEESQLEEFEGAYFYLLNVKDDEIVLKVKKSLPKPGKNEEKIDDGFCSLTVDEKYWPKLKEIFFWDVPEGKKVKIEHELLIDEIVLPEGEKDPAKIRELAKRKGKIIRKMDIDGNVEEKEYELEG